MRIKLLLALGPLGLLVATGPVAAEVSATTWGSLPLYSRSEMTGALAPGDTLSVGFVHCNVDVRSGRHASCKAIDRAAFTKAHPGELDAPVWRWAAKTFKVVDVEPDREERVALARGEEPGGPARVLIEDRDQTELVDELRTYGCEGVHDRPCDRATERTGRQIAHKRNLAVEHRWSTHLTPQGAAPILERLGYRVTMAFQLDYLRLFHTVHEAKLESVVENGYRIQDAYAYVQTAQDTDPDAQLALAWDRTLLAAQLRDEPGFMTAYKELVALHPERQRPQGYEKVVDLGLAIYKQIADGKVATHAPAGLESVMIHDPY